MIQMIKGIYGLVVNGTVEAMTPSSGPFELTAEREAELVKAGVAEKVETPSTTDPYAGMKMADLRKTAAGLGIDTGTAKTRKDLITLIEAAKSQGGADE